MGKNLINRHGRLLMEKNIRDDLKNPEKKTKIIRTVQELLFILTAKRARSYELKLKIETFKSDLLRLYKSFQEDFKFEQPQVISQFVAIFQKFAGMQQNIVMIKKKVEASE